MANFVFNIAKGKVAELAARVVANDPTNSAIIVLPINTTATDATLKDLDTMTAIEGDVNTAEVGSNRKTITNPTVTVDDTNDRMNVAIPNQTWTAVTGTAWTDLVVLYDPDTTGGTDSDLVPLCLLDFAVTPDGSDITAQFNAEGIFRAAD